MSETQIFNTARQIASPEERDRYLDHACGGDPDMKARITARLRERESPNSPFDVTHLAGQDEQSPDDIGIESAGEQIGPYQLVKQIGQGGMGSVWLAEQREPVTRAVALKIIKAGMDTQEVIARFEAERQALARMNHPNIARVLDAGATDRGRPFFVMELVDGVPVTKYCDARRMSTEQRLQLFCTICHAIQHAHQKGIIHRDIKPSNVLVTEIDGQPVVKVIDFGLAKATDARLTEQSMFTRLGQIVGTPSYMSPEQADAGLDIDTRTDVYSLGVLLYQLLTGVTPLDVTTLHRAAYAELQRMIRDFEPPRMSARLSALGEESTITATNRATDSRRLAQTIRGDLDVIAMKALEKDRDRRYETPDSFAADVQRFLNREVIEARPASAWYRIQKFWARNRVAVGMAAVLVLALVGGTVFSTWQAVRANRAAAAERTANEQSQQRLLQIERGSDILGAIFKDIDLRQIEGDGKTLEQVLGERLQQAAAQLTDDAVGDLAVTAKLQALLGESLYSLGYFDESIALFKSAVETRSKLLGPDAPETLTCQHNLAESYVLAGQYDLAIPMHEETLKRSVAALGPKHYDTVSSMKDLGNAHVAVGDYTAGLPLLEDALRLARETVDSDDELTLTAMNSLAVGYHYSGQTDLALPLYEETLKRRRDLYGADHYDTMTGMNNLASCYYAIGEVERALPLMQEVYDLRKAKLGADHPHTIISMANLAVVLEGAGKREEALPYFEEALAISETKNGPEHPGTLLRIRNLANCCKDLGQTDRALGLFQDYVDRHAAVHGDDSLEYADAVIYFGFVLVELERWSDAEPLLRTCLSLREQHLPADDWRIAGARSLLGAALTGLAQFDEAESLLIAGYEGQKASEADMPANAKAGIGQALERIITFYERRNASGDAEKAETWKAARTE